MTNLLAMLLLQAAVTLTGLPMSYGVDVPQVLAIDHATMAELYCAPALTCHMPLAVYGTGSGIIAYDADEVKLDTVYGKSILVHEMVHFLQDRTGMKHDGCASQFALEVQAYTMQYRYLIQHDVPITVRQVMSGWHPDCPAVAAQIAELKGK